MLTNSIDGGVRELAASMVRIKTHLSWMDLERVERRKGDPIVTAASQRILDDVRSEVSHFHAVVNNVFDALNDDATNASMPASVQHYWRSRALQLDLELNRLPLPKSF